MKYVECPEECYGAGPDITLFLAGGITNCPNWQQEMVTRLSDSQLTLVNPRRKIWKDGDAVEQIKWEHRHLTRCDAVLFWFPSETVCPITLPGGPVWLMYELGAWAFRPKKIFVGCHPNYNRKLDVEIQVGLERVNLVVVSSIQDLAQQVLDWNARKELNRFHRDTDQPGGVK